MESDLLTARVNDTQNICERTLKPKFLGFLSLEQKVFVESILKNRTVSYSFYGGYETAERVMLGCFPDWIETCDFPIKAITFTYRKSDKLRHSDFLGSLMALGITRESVGDILIEEGRTVVFVTTEIADYVLSEIEKVGRIGVELKLGFTSPLPSKGELALFSETVSSLRLDCVVSALAGVSRSQAERKIGEGVVSVNSLPCEKTTKTVNEGDIVSIRGKGKFIIDSVADRTKKDRIILKYKKYL